jgi:hypothetical protein
MASLVRHRAGAGWNVRSTVAATAAILLAFLLALPAFAVTGPTRLVDPSVSPVAATPGTTIHFEVTYRNREGSPPDAVAVVIAGSVRAMSVVSASTNWKAGVRFAYSTTLPLGTHDVVFNAVDRERFRDEVAGGSVTIAIPATPPPTAPPTARPTPPPTPTPSQTARPSTTPSSPTPKPTEVASRTAKPSPPASATPRPTSTPATTPSGPSTSSPTPGASPSDGASATPSGAMPPSLSPDPSATPPSPDPSLPGAAVASTSPSPGASAAPAGGDDPTAGSARTGDGPGSGPIDLGGGSGDTTGPTWGDLSAALLALGFDSPTWGMPLVPTMISTAGGVTLMMGLMFFGKRRRDGEQPEPDEALSMAAATGTGDVATAALVPPPASQPVDVEMSMPRWRRPSLVKARKNDPLRNAAPPPPKLSFENGLVGALDGHERRIIRYSAVRLLDSPDELRGAGIGVVSQGDEVQLLEQTGTYWRVLTPDGRQGWLHRMTLGEVVDVAASRAREPEPEGPAWDADALIALMTARGQA